jgi:macrocin-O-methyltransferase TylF-like protien
MRRLLGRMFDALSERLADRIARKMLSQLYFRELHPATLLQREAQAEAAAYVKEKMPKALYFMEREPLLRYAVDRVTRPGLFLEFGVFSGKSIWVIAERTSSAVHGFDSFEGLPEDWTGNKDPKGQYSTGGRLPDVPPNVRLYRGWFSDTLPAFFQAHPDDVAFMHIDCDLYSSTRDVLEATAAQLREGTVIVLDDYFNFPGWRNHEFKALQELVGRTGMEYEYVGYARHQVALIVKRAPSRPAP